ncbi:MAG: hypothetical protein ACE5IZ_02795 [Dehalococcoidia bacterium]
MLALPRRRLWLAVLALAAVAVVAAACGGGAQEEAAAPAPPSPPTELVRLKDGLPDFDLPAVTWNSYWYSRYNLGNLVMMSGLGVTFMPDMEGVQAMVKAVDQGAADGEHVALPKNPALLKAVYAGGDPTLINAFDGDPTNLANWRWDPTKMDTTITPSAQAQTIIKEVEWAKLFNNDSWAGKVTDDFGAMDRFKGVVLFAEAKMQVDFALREMRNQDGLFVAAVKHVDGETTVTDDSVRLANQLQMLQALADVHSVLHNPQDFNGVYADETFHQMVAQAADDLFGRITDMSAEDLQELSLGAQAYTWYAATTHDGQRQQEAVDLIKAYGDELATRAQTDVVERAQAIRGLIEAGRVLGDQAYLDAAAAAFNEMVQEYDPALGYFSSRTDLTIWEVGDIVGALNALLKHGGPKVEARQVSQVLVGFFEAAINRSGLMQAVPPKEMEASPFELQRVGKDLFFGYPTIPTPDVAGAAAVDASAITMDMEGGRWVVSDGRFDTAGAMHTANEEVWTFGLVSGFPEVKTAAAALETR